MLAQLTPKSRVSADSTVLPAGTKLGPYVVQSVWLYRATLMPPVYAKVPLAGGGGGGGVFFDPPDCAWATRPPRSPAVGKVDSINAHVSLRVWIVVRLQ